jgi:hypothetical protein
MPSHVSCSEGHTTKSISVHEAAVALANQKAVGVCKKCGKELHYKIDQILTRDPDEKDESYIVTRAIRLGTRSGDEKQYDPFLLVLKNVATGEEQVMPTFWARGQNNTQRGGHFPPLLSLEEWKSLFRRLDGSAELEERIRMRAYELYERRGRLDGYAVADWLQAEAELKKKKRLRAVA